ncbi:LysR family transcriptional regulator [Fontibacillus phaseoli]|uniref:LysR family transcriptional regulator n=1 Tax=Fontibacillus phaseoli TaxID=1416533 RepID=A0A369B5G1_9BACL|nr:LysR family transcriptional regulator [Fontibacillus phaseoli]RCX16723.1 LysR family transcriptional regulator [Fontibacillus phaseoli]
MIVETLRVFVTVAEQSHFSRAAEMLNLSQPGVSLHVRNLENEFGAQLLNRSPKHVKLTEEGEILYRQAKQILALYEGAKQEIRLLHEIVTGSIHIGASFTIGEYILPRMLAEFATGCPEVEMQVTIGNTEEITRGVRLSELDLGLVEGEVPDQSEMRVTPYMKDEMIVVAAPEHPLSSLRRAEYSYLQNLVWILRESGSGTRAFSDRFLQERSLTVKQSYVFNSSQGVKEAVAAGLGVALLSRWVVRKELASGELLEIITDGTALQRDFSLIRNKHASPTLAVDMFLQKLLEVHQ